MSDRIRTNPPTHLVVRLGRRFIQALLNRAADFTERGDRGAAERPGRSIAIWVVDCGSSGAVEQEIQAIFNPVYDAEGMGFSLATSPRHADLLLVSGPLTRNMETALLATFAAMPEPRRVVTIGNDIIGQGIFNDPYAVIPLPEKVATACVAHIPGDPPTPVEILTILHKISSKSAPRSNSQAG